MGMLYTFVLDWNGGTFVSQCESSCVVDAIKIWSEKFPVESIGASVESGPNFLASLESERPIPVGGLTSVWCVSALIEDSLALIHIVATHQPGRPGH